MVSVRKRALRVRSGRIGVISDTHGLVRAEALAALKGSEIIFHAGDIGRPEVLTALAALAPVIAIRGNNDRAPWANKLPDRVTVRVNGIGIHMIHNVREMESVPAGDIGIVVSGHSHKPNRALRDGVLFLNPGSAGPRRFKLPVAVARVTIGRRRLRSEIVEIKLR